DEFGKFKFFVLLPYPFEIYEEYTIDVFATGEGLVAKETTKLRAEQLKPKKIILKLEIEKKYRIDKQIEVKGTAYFDNELPLKNTELKIKFIGKEWKTTTDIDGRFKYNIGAGKTKGKYMLTVSIESKDYGLSGKATSEIELFGKEEKMEFPYLLLGIGFGIAIGIFLAIFISYRALKKKVGYVECGSCGSFILESAEKCPDCGTEFEKEIVKCSECESWIPSTVDTCPKCKAKFKEK
ncbi:MAG: hypothetical protein AB1779_12240, partial [Candidatus Thermoplasmatota archaeon]